MPTRPPAIAGRFYPADPRAIATTIEQIMAQAPEVTENAPQPTALIAPHAGWVFSGVTAAHAYQHIAPYRQSIHRVIILCPTHREAVRGIAIPESDAFATPLGSIPLDTKVMQTLSPQPLVHTADSVHAFEHAIEVHLPFLQTLLDDFTLLPIAVGAIAPNDLQHLLEQIPFDHQTLFIVSTDLSHFHTADEANTLDSTAIDWIDQGHTESLTPHHACGANILRGFLPFARAQHWHTQFLHRSHSGEVSGDNERVVGYASWVVTSTLQPPAEH